MEAGLSHTLLLNTNGEVFSFGEGLQGQVGTGEKTLHLDHPTQIYLESGQKSN